MGCVPVSPTTSSAPAHVWLEPARLGPSQAALRRAALSLSDLRHAYMLLFAQRRSTMHLHS